MTDSESAIRAREFYTQGVAFFQRGQLVEATDAFRYALRAVPSHIEARMQLGVVLLKRGRGDEGLRELDAGLTRENMSSTERVRLLQQAASCAASSSRYDLARTYLERALQLGTRPDHNIVNHVAAVCCKGGHFETGFGYFLRAAKIQEDRRQLLGD